MDQQKNKASYITVQGEFSGQRLDNFLLRELKGVPRSLIYRIVRRGEVRVNDSRARVHNRLKTGDRIRIPPLRVSSRALERPSRVIPGLVLRPLYEDEDLIIIDKPAGIAVHAGSGIRTGLIEHMRASSPELRYLELVHRLDRGTSGCLIVAKRSSVLRALHQDLRENSGRNRRFVKRYQALVHGCWGDEPHMVEIPLHKNVERSGERVVVVAADGMFAKTKFHHLRSFPACTLMEATLYTGRTHQVRVHASACGHPVLGDEKYGNSDSAGFGKRIGLRRLFLHASFLSFDHPRTSRRIEVASPLPLELQKVLARAAVVNSSEVTPGSGSSTPCAT